MAKFRKLEEFFFAYFFNVIMDFYFNVIFAKKKLPQDEGVDLLFRPVECPILFCSRKSAGVEVECSNVRLSTESTI